MKTLSRFCALLLVAATGSQAAPVSHQWKDCRYEFTDDRLILGNSKIRRVWHLGSGLIAHSLLDLASSTEWQAPGAVHMPVGDWTWSCRHEVSKAKVVEKESLQLLLSCKESGQAYRIRIFSNTAAIDVMALSKPEAGADAVIDELKLADSDALSFTQVELKDHTDKNMKGLVFTEQHDFSEAFTSSGNVSYIENPKTGHGLLFLKLAPLPHARANKSAHDFSWQDGVLQWKGPGYNSISKHGYACAVVTYSGSRTGRIAASQQYQRCLRAYVPGRDGMLLSNTWGDRSRDAKISEAFLIKEIIAGKRLGADVMQADDGWQRGTTQNSAVARSKSGVWSGFWKADPKFWSPHEERLPKGLGPVADAANEHGMMIGIWYAPDSDDDFGNWERDANRILELHRAHGVTYFKLDSIVMQSEIAEHRVSQLMNKVIEESLGKVVIDLDVTAGVRPGYLGAVSVGTVFVENRYTDWGSYWPHKTLRNFWELSEHIDPLRLRMEFLNNARNADKYKDNPLAPATYSPSYLFATVMFSSPLAWFEVSELPEAFAEEVKPLIAAWRAHRVAIHQGDMIPIGEVPSGKSWTGFCSIAVDRKSGYAVIFRELNEQASAVIDVPFIDGSRPVEILHGKGRVEIVDGKLHVELDETRSFVFVKF